MAVPTAALTDLRPDLGTLMELDIEAERQGFIGLRVAPTIDVAVQTGKFGKIEVEELLRERATRRAARTGYNRGEGKFTTDTFATEEHGVEEVVDAREAELYAEYFDAELVSAEVARDVILRAQEKRIADLVFNTTTWTGASLTTAATAAWDQAATAKPIDDVDNAKIKVQEGTGMWPDTVIMSRKVFMNLRNVDQIIDRLKYQGFQDVRPSAITAQALAQVFDVRQVLIGGSARNSAKEGAALSIADLWGDGNVMVAKVAETQNVREPCLARTFHWSADGSQIGGTIESYDEVQVRGRVIRVRHDVQERVMLKELGHLITGIST